MGKRFQAFRVVDCKRWAEEIFQEAISIYKEIFAKGLSSYQMVENFSVTHSAYGEFLPENGKAAAVLENYRQPSEIIERNSAKTAEV